MLVGAGNDEARYDRDFANGGTAAVTVDLAARTGVDGFGNTDTLRNVEWVRGTQNADVMLGADSNDQFRGLAGADFFDGRGGFNTIDYSKDVSYGGILGVVVDFGTLTAKDSFGATDTFVFNSIQAASGGDFADKMTGDGSANRFVGNGGNDTLNGGGGNDTLVGGLGNDNLTGSSGADRFVFNALGEGADIITDFSAAETDKLVFVVNSATGFGALPTPPAGGTSLLAANFDLNATGAATKAAGTAEFVFNTVTHQLFYDSNGSTAGGQTLIATLTGVSTMLASDIRLNPT